MPIVRGRIIPETESAGRKKQLLDVLLRFKSAASAEGRRVLDDLEQLRVYLDALAPPVCAIALHVMDGDTETAKLLETVGVGGSRVVRVQERGAVPEATWGKLSDEAKVLAATALACDADCVVTDDALLLPYVEELETLGVLLTSPAFLLRYAEVFVRGHDVPWAFSYVAWYETWTGFYQLSEAWTFQKGLELLRVCNEKGIGVDRVETGRSLIYNRLGDICFTRDRLLFYEMQQAVAKRAHWKRQRFAAEVAYHLNFYYLLLWGAFDHAAVFTNAILQLNVKERRVGARSEEFLKALAKYPAVLAIFEKNAHTEFMDRVGAVRHTAAHRGVVTPTKVVAQPDKEPTVEELDADIKAAGLDGVLTLFPAGKPRDEFLEVMRSNARMARYERETLMEDVILVEIDGKWGFIRPMVDTWYNFKKCLAFLNDVFVEVQKAL